MKSKFLISVSILLALMTIDRYLWMPDRAEKLWMQESGRNLGDPIAFNQDFYVDGQNIIFYNNKDKESYPVIFENRKSKFIIAGCYFGKLYIYDSNRKELITYFEK